jgi:hypothetical protein
MKEYHAQRQASARLSVEADAKELRAAALNGDLRKVEAQLAAGADVDGRAGDGQVRAMIGPLCNQLPRHGDPIIVCGDGRRRCSSRARRVTRAW